MPLGPRIVLASNNNAGLYNGRGSVWGSVWGYSTELSGNWVAGSGNNLTAYRSEDPRVRTAGFATLRANANYTSSVGNGWLWAMRGQLQYSPDALISGEQFGLGGASSIRGTSERPISGDKGMLASLELSTPDVAPGLRLLGFVDAGWLRNNSPNATNKPASDQLASVGLGLRYSMGVVGVSAEWGRVVTGSSVPLTINAASPRAGDVKFHLNLTARF